MFIFSGWGIAPIPIGVAAFYLALVLAQMPGVNPDLENFIFAAGAALAAVSCWIVGVWLNNPTNRHTLMFIPLQWYAVPYAALAILFISAANPHSNANAGDASRPAITTSNGAAPERATVNTENLNLRDSASAKGTRLAQLPRGTVVRILQTFENGWAKIGVVTMGDTGESPSQALGGFVNGAFLARAEITAPTPAPAPKQESIVRTAVPQIASPQVVYRCDNLNFNTEGTIFRFAQQRVPLKIVSVFPDSLSVSEEEYDADGPSRTNSYRNKYRYRAKQLGGDDIGPREQVVEITDRYIVYGSKDLTSQTDDGRDKIIDKDTGIMKALGTPFQCVVLRSG